MRFVTSAFRFFSTIANVTALRLTLLMSHLHLAGVTVGDWTLEVGCDRFAVGLWMSVGPAAIAFCIPSAAPRSHPHGS